MSRYEVDRAGRIKSGPHLGKYVLIERDETESGWHVWVLTHPPGTLPNEGWDIWADDKGQLDSWFEDPDFEVEWLGSDAAPPSST